MSFLSLPFFRAEQEVHETRVAARMLLEPQHVETKNETKARSRVRLRSWVQACPWLRPGLGCGSHAEPYPTFLESGWRHVTWASWARPLQEEGNCRRHLGQAGAPSFSSPEIAFSLAWGGGRSWKCQLEKTLTMLRALKTLCASYGPKTLSNFCLCKSGRRDPKRASKKPIAMTTWRVGTQVSSWLQR